MGRSSGCTMMHDLAFVHALPDTIRLRHHSREAFIRAISRSATSLHDGDMLRLAS